MPAVPPAGHVRVKMLAAAIHPSDFGMIAGTYGKAKTFPCVMGREGVGEVVALAGDVKNVTLGDWVRIPEALGAWTEALDCPAKGLVLLPKDLKPDQLSLSFVNPPAALRVLEDYATLNPGDVVVTNAGKSAVSQAFYQLAREMGLKPHGVVRNKTAEDEVWLKSLGAEAVWDETEEYFKQIKPKLALNQVGGESVLRLIKSLADHGVCVTIGGAAKEPVRYPTRELIFKDIQLRGFWADRFFREHTPVEIDTMLHKLWALMRAGRLTQEVSGRYALAEFSQALAEAAGANRRGKVMFVGA